MTEKKPQVKIDFTAEELATAYNALIVDFDGRRIGYETEEQPCITSTMVKLQKCLIKNDGPEHFEPGPIEFTTEEKALILSKLKRKWDALSSEYVSTLRSKLE